MALYKVQTNQTSTPFAALLELPVVQTAATDALRAYNARVYGTQPTVPNTATTTTTTAATLLPLTTSTTSAAPVTNNTPPAMRDERAVLEQVVDSHLSAYNRGRDAAERDIGGVIVDSQESTAIAAPAPAAAAAATVFRSSPPPERDDDDERDASMSSSSSSLLRRQQDERDARDAAIALMTPRKSPAAPLPLPPPAPPHLVHEIPDSQDDSQRSVF